MQQQGASLTGFWEEATARYQESLVSSVAEEYLESRGINETARLTGRLGFVGTDPMPGHEQFEGMLAIPYDTPAGVVGMKFRNLKGGQPKYTAPLGQKVRMFQVLALQEKTDTMYVAEGELDALILYRVLQIPAVGIAGVTQFKPHHPRVLKGFQNIIVVTDNDTPKEDGANPGQELARRIIDAIPHARNISLPEGKDINEVLTTEGESALRARLGVHG